MPTDPDVRLRLWTLHRFRRVALRLPGEARRRALPHGAAASTVCPPGEIACRQRWGELLEPGMELLNVV
jgi:hypothetical protein